MSRVASEAPSVQPSRPHAASARNTSDANSKPSPSPFAEMLDSATPASDPATAPAPRQARSERPEKAESADKAKSAKAADSHPADAKPRQDAAAAPEAKVAGGSDDGEVATESKDIKSADAGKNAETDAAKLSTDADGKTGPDQDPTASPDTLFADATKQAVVAPPVAAVVPAPALAPVATDAVASPSGSSEITAAEIGALATSPGAGQGLRVSPSAAPKIAPPQFQQGDKPGDASSKGAPADNAQTAPPQIEPAKDIEPRGNSAQGGDDKEASAFRHAAADQIAKLGTEAPASNSGDAAGAAKSPADAGQSAAVLGQANAPSASAATTAPAAAQAQSQATVVPLAGLAVEIATQANAGKNHIEIRLDPPELGRIAVKLDVDRDGNVSTRMVVDRSDTLDLLKRDASTLERALQQAGLKTSEHGLDFSLRQHAFADQQATPQSAARLVVPDDDTAPLDALRQGYGRLLGLGGGLDIRV